MGDGIEQDGAQLLAFARGFCAAEFFDGAGALHGDADQAPDRFQGLPRKERARNAHAADDAHAHAERHEGELLVDLDVRLSAQGNHLQVVRFEAIDGGSGTIDVGAIRQGDGGGADAEGVHDVARDGVQQLGAVVARKQQLAEGVEAFQFLAALDGGPSPAAGAFRQFAGGDGGDEEGEQRDPVLRVGNGERADGRQEVVVEGKGRDHRHEDRLLQAVERGDPQHAQQKCQRNGGVVEMKAVADECNSRDNQRGDQISERLIGRRVSRADCNRHRQKRTPQRQ